MSGVVGTGLVLQLNNREDLTISADGSFKFPSMAHIGDPYAITVKTQPMMPSQICEVSNGTGIVSDAPIEASVTCATSAFTVGVAVTGLAGSGLVLQNNLGDDLAVSSSGIATFATSVLSGAPFAVSVLSQPTTPSQHCTVAGGDGTVGSAPVTSIAVNCSTDHFTVGGSIFGIVGTVTLKNNGSDDITVSSQGTFAFPTPLLSGATYDVTVTNHIGAVSQTCTVTHESGTVGGSAVADVAVDCTTDHFAVNATVSGLATGNTVVLQNNGADDLTVTADSTQTFAGSVASGSAYAVSVVGNPSGQTCTVTNGSGTIGAADVTATVTCVQAIYSVKANVVGLSGSITLRDNGGDDLTLTNNGTATFATQILSGGAYAVTVSAQPSGQYCTVQNGTGTIGSADVTATVTCATPCFQVTNTAAEDLTGNSWFDTCATAPGNTVTVVLLDTNGNVIYQHGGTKVGTWTPYDYLTAAPALGLNSQYDGSQHANRITLDNGDVLAIVGRAATNGACWGSMGAGYGIQIYAGAPSQYSNVRLMVESYKSPSNSPRGFSGWSTSSEITYNAAGTESTCNGVASSNFLGTFSFIITP